MFTLASDTTVFAGLYWNGPVTPASHMPVGFLNGGNTNFIRFASADPPSVGSAISGGNSGNFTRTYDFSIDVGVVPEPSTILLLGSGLAGLVAWRMRKGRA